MRVTGIFQGRLIDDDARLVVLPAAVTDDPAELPPQDVVFVTLKAQAQPEVAAAVAGLLKPDGLAVFVANGVPWWLGQGLATPLPDFAPGISVLAECLGTRSIGCVVYSNNEVVQPGVVQHYANNRWLMGEYDGSHSSRLTDVCSMLSAAGIQAEAHGDLRRQVWQKLARNIAFGPLCALTRLEPPELNTEELRTLQRQLLEEVAATAKVWGWELDLSQVQTQPGAALQAAARRPSMLQDVLLGREVEVEPQLDRVRVLATTQGVPTPALDTVAALLHGLNAAMHLNP